MIKLCDLNPAARQKLPPAMPDKSGIGVHYIDAFVAPLNAALLDGTRVSCKRKGLRSTLRGGAKKGDGLMRRLTVSADPGVMLAAALQEAAQAARRATGDHRPGNSPRPVKARRLYPALHPPH
jgi:hypothetical protein